MRISHADRVLDPLGATKLELARYYDEIGERMLPFVKDRPLTLLRWAEGKPTEKGGVYLRHARAWGPSVLERVRIGEKTKTGEYLVARDIAGLVALAQMDILEIHTWNATVDDVERPDRLVIDLDPAPDVPWDKVVDAAREVRDSMAKLGLSCWPKTTGGKGLHLVTPLVPDASWEDCLRFARAFAGVLAARAPSRYVVEMGKAKRAGRIFVDYLRNNRTNTSVAAFSTRAKPGKLVSAPVAWSELPAATNEDFTMEIALRRARSSVDPWRSYASAARPLPVFSIEK